MTWKESLPAPGEIEYSNWPEKAAPSDYGTSAQEELDFLRKLTKQASIYQSGTINAPGISDLDFIVVLDDNDQTHQLHKWKALHRYLSPMTQYLTTHEPLIVNPEMWRSLTDFKVLENLRHMSGPILAAPGSSSNAPALTHLLVVAEFHIFRPYKRFLNEILRRQVQVRPALSRMQKLKVEAMILGDVGVQHDKWSEFIGDISNLRSDWFNLDMRQQIDSLHRLMVTCAEIDAEMISEISTALANSAMNIPAFGQAKNRVFGALDYTTIFVGDYQAQLSLEYAVKAGQKSGEMFSVLPANFMLPLLIYASYATIAKRYLDERVMVFGNTRDLGEWPLHKEPIVTDRVNHLDAYFRFLESQNLDKGLLFRRSQAPRSNTESAKAFWQSVEPQIEQLDDIPTLVLRKQLGDTRTQLHCIMNGASLKVPLLALMRYFRNRLAPRGSRRARILGWPVRAILAQSWRFNFKR